MMNNFAYVTLKRSVVLGVGVTPQTSIKHNALLASLSAIRNHHQYFSSMRMLSPTDDNGPSRSSSISSSSSTPTPRRPIMSVIDNFRQFSTSTGISSLPSSSCYRALDEHMISLIKKDFEAADVSNDGKIDSNDLKQLLRRHKGIFRESEIQEIAELFYIGSAGKSLPFDNLIEAIDNTLVLSKEEQSDKTKRNVLGLGSCGAEYLYDLHHHKWESDELNVNLTHVQPRTVTDRMALSAVKAVRVAFDTMTGWNDEITAEKVMQRVIFLETIAAVPGMVAAIIRHFRSLRNMERDGGLINMFLEEATNERMHLLTFVGMRDPSIFFRAAVIGSQFAFGSGFFLAYCANPSFCHRFVGYIEEEACSTYTKIIEAIEKAPEDSDLAKWRTEPAPKIGISYWHLGENGTVLDLFYAVRADEAEHRDVNHSVCGMQHGDVNPRMDPKKRVELALNKYVRHLMLGTSPKLA